MRNVTFHPIVFNQSRRSDFASSRKFADARGDRRGWFFDFFGRKAWLARGKCPLSQTKTSRPLFSARNRRAHRLGRLLLVSHPAWEIGVTTAQRPEPSSCAGLWLTWALWLASVVFAGILATL